MNKYDSQPISIDSYVEEFYREGGARLDDTGRPYYLNVLALYNGRNFCSVLSRPTEYGRCFLKAINGRGFPQVRAAVAGDDYATTKFFRGFGLKKTALGLVSTRKYRAFMDKVANYPELQRDFARIACREEAAEYLVARLMRSLIASSETLPKMYGWDFVPCHADTSCTTVFVPENGTSCYGMDDLVTHLKSIPSITVRKTKAIRRRDGFIAFPLFNKFGSPTPFLGIDYDVWERKFYMFNQNYMTPFIGIRIRGDIHLRYEIFLCRMGAATLLASTSKPDTVLRMVQREISLALIGSGCKELTKTLTETKFYKPVLKRRNREELLDCIDELLVERGHCFADAKVFHKRFGESWRFEDMKKEERTEVLLAYRELLDIESEGETYE